MKELFFNIFNIRNKNSILNQLIRTIIVILEKYKIFFKAKILNYKNTVLVYDCKVSPGTFGEFMEILLLARAIKSYNLKIKIVLITGEFRESWNKRFDKSSRQEHIKYMKYLTKKILLEKKNVFFEMPWNEFKKKFTSLKNNEEFILFKRKVYKRRPIYTHAINLTNHILKNKVNLQNKILLKSKDIKVNLNKNSLKKKYISIGCRYVNGDSSRNLTKALFLKLIKKLNKFYPEYNKIVISNNSGCNYFKKISKKYSLGCKFSKDYSSDFLGDGKIILNSKAFFEIRGGGICAFALFSRVPFLKVNSFHPIEHHYIIWSKAQNKVYSWQNGNQIFVHMPKSFKTSVNDQLFFNKLDYFSVNSKLN